MRRLKKISYYGLFYFFLVINIGAALLVGYHLFNVLMVAWMQLLLLATWIAVTFVFTMNTFLVGHWLDTKLKRLKRAA